MSYVILNQCLRCDHVKYECMIIFCMYADCIWCLRYEIFKYMIMYMCISVCFSLFNVFTVKFGGEQSNLFITDFESARHTRINVFFRVI